MVGRMSHNAAKLNAPSAGDISAIPSWSQKYLYFVNDKGLDYSRVCGATHHYASTKISGLSLTTLMPNLIRCPQYHALVSVGLSLNGGLNYLCCVTLIITQVILNHVDIFPG
jgi:hypothetical protein